MLLLNKVELVIISTDYKSVQRLPRNISSVGGVSGWYFSKKKMFKIRTRLIPTREIVGLCNNYSRFVFDINLIIF